MNTRRINRIVRLAAPMTLGFLHLMTVNMSAQTIIPVPLPDPNIPGFRFPTQEGIVNNWVTNDNQTAINKHAWGIWTALTMETKQRFDDQILLVFETWKTPFDVKNSTSPTPRQLKRFRQFSVGHASTAGDETVLGFVKYDPSAAKHIEDNNLFSTKKLASLLAAGRTKIPDFPFTAVSLKPVFQTIAKGALVDGRYYQLPAWPGPANALNYKYPLAFPSTDWKQCVWIDVKNESKGNGGVDTVCDSKASRRTAENTYNVSSLINFQLDELQAKAVNESNRKNWKNLGVRVPAGGDVAKGDYSILVAMHVTTREITRWTWQTFWWTPNPDKPHLPSSPKIAKDRPSQLKGAARNYAHAPAYSMASPAQPCTGGENVGKTVYAYNPWLEAGFGPNVLTDSKSGLTYNGKIVLNDVGVQSNCMSCHAQANYSPSNITNPPGYTGDRYIDLNGPEFKGTLQVDFLWSIPANLSP